MHTAYAEYQGKLDPPSGAHNESVESLAAKLNKGNGALAWLGQTAVASVLYQPQARTLYLSRLAVLPAYRRGGIGRQLVEYVEAVAQKQGLAYVTLGVRLALPQNLEFYQRLGYSVAHLGSHPGYIEPTFYTLQKQVLPEA
jgi:ribosomal protein S18 acetylase RimI-like enzyme